jgi:ATP-dependent Clp protease protease subunit
MFIPYVLEKTQQGERSYDLFTRLLNQDRIVLVTDEVTDASMTVLIAELLYLNSLNHDPIHMYIMSPGGSCLDGFAALDIMNYIASPVYTYCIGYAASMGAALLSNGEKGHRMILPNSQVMCHRSAGGSQGRIMDAKVSFENWEELDQRLAALIARNCGMTLDDYEKTVERDHWMWPETALKFGIVDAIIRSEEDAKLPILTSKDVDALKQFSNEMFSGANATDPKILEAIKKAEKIAKDSKKNSRKRISQLD